MAQSTPGPRQQKPTTDPATQINNAMRDTPQNLAAGVARGGGQQITPAQQINSAMQNASAQTPMTRDTSGAVKAPARGAYDQPLQNPTQAATPTQTPAPSAQAQANAQTTQEATGGIYRVGDNGQAPKGLKAGDQVVTGGGTYTIKSVNPDGTYQSQLTNPNQTTGNYGGQYANAPVAPTNVYRVGADGKAPTGLKVGDQVVTAGGTYQITGVNADGTYQSQLVNRNQTTANYTGAYANGQGTAPATTPAAPEVPAYARPYADNVDYSAEIEKAVAAGDLGAAAILEKMRNAKIEALGLQNQYAITNTFAQYLDQISPEYAAQLMNGYVPNTGVKTQNPMGEIMPLVDQLYAANNDRLVNQIDYATNKGVNELERAQEDARELFQNQRDQNDIDTARAMSNSGLYAEMRGDRGGIGQSQYNEIQAAALKNAQAINTAQTKLATDTARQVADLRAQGEYQKADALLQTTQQYLTQLISLRQWGAEFGLTLEQMQREIDQWKRNYDIQVANITGVYNGQPTYSAQKNAQADAQSLLSTAIKMGIMPSEALLKAAGYDSFSGDIGNIANMAALSFSSGGSGGGGSGGRSGSGSGSGSESGTGTPVYTEQVTTDPEDNTVEYGKGDVKGRTSVNASKQYGGASSSGKMTSLSYSPDEGIFTWNGKNYNHVNALIKDINAAGLTADQEATLIKKLASWGFKKP